MGLGRPGTLLPCVHPSLIPLDYRLPGWSWSRVVEVGVTGVDILFHEWYG